MIDSPDIRRFSTPSPEAQRAIQEPQTLRELSSLVQTAYLRPADSIRPGDQLVAIAEAKREAHRAALGEIAGSLPTDGMSVTQSQPEQPAVCVPNDERGTLLARLGLPEPQGRRTTRVGSVLVYRRNQQAVAIEQVGLTYMGDHPMIYRAHLYDEGRILGRGVGTLTWLEPGDSMFPPPDDTMANVRLTTAEGKQALEITPSSNAQIGDEIIVLRDQLTPEERREERRRGPIDTESSRRRQRWGRRAAAVALAASTVSLLPGGADHDTMTSASQAVRLDGQFEVDGIPQAEALYGPETLQRARAAFEAFFAGDKQRLAAIAQEQGHAGEWIPATAIEQVRNAQSIDEVIERFNQAVGDVPVRLDVLREGTSRDDLYDKYQHKPITAGDLSKAIDQAVTMLGVLDHFSPNTLWPTDVVLVNSIKDPSQNLLEKAVGMDELGGYCLSGGAADATIVLGVAHSGGKVAPHEFGHNLATRTDLEAHVSALIPQDLLPRYYIDDKFELDPFGVSNTMDGVRVATEPYGRRDEHEAVAVAGQDALAPNPELLLENGSVASEKTMAVLLDAEQKDPGFIAALLTKARQYQAPMWLRAVNKIGQAIATVQEVLPSRGWAIAGIIATGGAAAVNRRMRRRRIREQKTARLR